MNGALVGAALLAALATVLVVLPTSDGSGTHRVRLPDGDVAAQTVAGAPGAAVDPGAHPGQSPMPVREVSLLAGAAVWLLLGGTIGVVGGAAVAVILPLAIARLEPAHVRRERLELVRGAPLVADLLSASLLAGVPLEQSIPVVARAVGGAACGHLLSVHRRTGLGEPMAEAFHDLGQAPGLGGIARAVMRSSRTGAPLAALLAQAATDLRADAAAAGLEQVRGTAVRAVLPLGLCLLPAFALLGIVPIVGGLLPAF